MRATAYIIWFAVSASDAIGALLACIYLFRLKGGFARLLSFVLLGIAVEAIVAAVSLLLFWQAEVLVQPEFAIARAIGRSVKALGVWCLVFYLLNICSQRASVKLSE